MNKPRLVADSVLAEGAYQEIISLRRSSDYSYKRNRDIHWHGWYCWCPFKLIRDAEREYGAGTKCSVIVL